MRGLALSLLSCSVFACTSSQLPPAGEDPTALGDEIDEAAKADGASAPGGFYLLDGDSLVVEEAPQFTEIDLRSNKTYYRTFGMLSPDDWAGNYSMGWSFDRGTFKFSKNSRTQKTYIRFYDEAGALVDVWRYSMDGARLQFHYRTDEGFTMEPQPNAPVEWVDTIVAEVETRVGADDLEGLINVSVYANGFPQPAREAAYTLGVRTASGITPASTYRLRLSDRTSYVVANASRVEIYAANGQMVAAGSLDNTAVTWDAL